MSKPLNERLAGALDRASARTTELQALLDEVSAECTRLAAVVASSAIDSVDFALSEEARDQAAAEGERARRTAAALEKARRALQERIDQRAASEKAANLQAERKRVIAERDQLAERLLNEWPVIEAKIVDLLSAVVANDQLLLAHRLPEISAEAVARGCPGNFRHGVVPIGRLTEILLPAFDGKSIDRAWPRAPRRVEVVSRKADQAKLQREQEQREAASWSPYVVSAGNAKEHDIVFRGKAHPGAPVTERHVYRNLGTGSAFEEERSAPKLVWLQEPTVARLRELGLSVERAPEPKPAAIAEPQLIGTTSASF